MTPEAIFDHAFSSQVGSVLLIDCAALKANAVRVRQWIGSRFFWAVVKANGYGLGAEVCARAFLAGGADGLAVARLEEAQALRKVGLTCPILIVGPLPHGLPNDATLHVTISTSEELARLGNQQNPAHLKIDTGMGRLGFALNSGEWLQAAQQLGSRLFGFCSHYSHADTPSHAQNLLQQQRFADALARLQTMGLRPQQIHLANSAGLALLQPSESAVRVGLYLYGVNPWSEPCAMAAPTPVLEWLTRLLNPRALAPNAGLSYRSLANLPAGQRAAVLPIGYADGLPALPSQVITVTVRGCQQPLVGRITMDMAIVALTDAAIKHGDLAYLLGPRGNPVAMNVETLAAAAGKISYELLTGIGQRVLRYYLNSHA